MLKENWNFRNIASGAVNVHCTKKQKNNPRQGGIVQWQNFRLQNERPWSESKCPRMKNFTDEQLVIKYLKGDEKSLERIIYRYLPLIYNFSRRYTGDMDNASDIAQEVFVKVWKNLKKFDTSKNFRTWLFTVAKNTALDWLKKRNAMPFSLLLEDVADSEQVSIIDKFYKKSLSQNLLSAIEKLPLKYSSVINLYHKDGFNFREIASFLNESINTIKSRYRRGLIMLKKTL